MAQGNGAETVPDARGWRATLIGRFRLACEGGEVRVGARKARAILAYLALAPANAESREKIAALLWSGASERQARASFRQTLWKLRAELKAGGPPLLEATEEEAALAPEAFATDLDAVLASVAADTPSPLIDQDPPLPDRLLSDLDDIDPQFDSWLQVQRHVLRERLVAALGGRLAALRDQADAAKRADIAKALIALDPTHEGAYRALMRDHAEAGNVAAALRSYETLWRLLNDDYDMEPSEETQALVAKIKLGERLSAAPPTPEPPAPPTEPPAPADRPTQQLLRLRIAGIEKDGVDGARRYIVDGFRHQLIASLIRFREWTIVDGASYRLGAWADETSDYLISGFAYEADGFIRIALTVRHEASEEYVWSEEFAVRLENWFTTLCTIVRRLAVCINVQISVERVRRQLRTPDMRPSDYDRWLRGQELAQFWRAEERLQAQEIFQSIIETSPNFAPAYVSLVNFENSRHLIFPGVYRSRRRSEAALARAKYAVKLAPTNCRGHLCAGWSYALNGQFDQAELSYQMAFELNENDSWTLISSALGLAFCGAHDLAKERIEAALDLGMTGQPLLWCYQVVCRFMCGDYEGAIWAAERSEDAIYNVPAWTSAALAQAGRIEDATRELRRFMDLAAGDWRGDAEPTDGEVARWLLHSFPIRHEADWRRLRDGLALAGAPTIDERPGAIDDREGVQAAERYSHSPVV